MDDEYIEKRLRELAVRTARRGEASFTHFLDLAEAQLALSVGQREGVRTAFFGGYDEAERRMAAYCADEPPEEWPIRAVRIGWRPQFGTPGHRDLLGAVMALGFERERIGDIVPDNDCAWLFAEPEMAEYVASSLDRAGRVSVKAETVDQIPEMPEPAGRTVREVVPSLRLDAVLAAGFSLSRSEASEAIARGKVLVDQAQTLKTDAPVREGQLISLRGTGRMKVKSVEGETKKGRIAVRLFLYGG